MNSNNNILILAICFYLSIIYEINVTGYINILCYNLFNGEFIHFNSIFITDFFFNTYTILPYKIELELCNRGQ